MTYYEIINNTIQDTLTSVSLVQPELVLCGTILVLLVLRVFDATKGLPTWFIAFVGTAVAFWLARPWMLMVPELVPASQETFTGLLVIDSFTTYFRGLLLFFTLLFILLSRISGIPDHEDSADYHTLVLGAILGMSLMASANHLLMLFLAVEMASVPSFVLAGLFKGRRQSSEAALKYAVYGAGAAGVMLYGVSLLAGVVGSCHLPTMAAEIASGGNHIANNQMALALGGLMVAVGLAFKLSAVPFHFWCPDVFEGASAEVAGFLSVASKAAALALLVRVAVGFGTSPIEEKMAVISPTEKVAVHLVSSEATTAKDARDSAETGSAIGSARNFMIMLAALIAGITCTFGNLAAYGQTNIKRLLAYSTIAHAGYMMMPVAAALSFLNQPNGAASAERAFSSILFYLAIYLFMNLGAFSIVAFLRNTMRSEQIKDYAGLVRTSPGVVICFAAILFGLIGIPPLAGFLGKFAIFMELAVANTPVTIALLVVGGLNTAISLFYYLRVVKVMTIDPPDPDRAEVRFSLWSLPGVYVAVLTVPVLFLIVQWGGLNEWARAACQHLIR